MIGIEVNTKKLKELREACGKAKKGFSKELAAAINHVAKQTKTNIGRDIRKTVNLKKDISERPIKMKSKATTDMPVARVVIEETRREGLQHFGARQDKRGVSYKISKQGGRRRVNGAFMGPSPGTLAPRLHGGVFKRAANTRLPIVKLYGVSPYGAYARNDFETHEVAFISKGLEKQIERRIKLNVLRANGLVSK